MKDFPMNPQNAEASSPRLEKSKGLSTQRSET
jgi:hypothetical protein